MKNKSILFLLCLCALAGLMATAVYAYAMGAGSLIMIVPKQDGVTLPLTALETVEEEHFPIAYGVRQEQSARASQKSHSVAIYGTNGLYAQILQLPLLNGNYFSPEAVKQSSRVAALNPLAAFTLFGGNDCLGEEVMLQNESYTVTGVIEDNDTENPNIYIPITRIMPAQLQQPDTVYVQETDSTSLSYMLGYLSSAGINDTSHRFIRLGGLSRMIQERALLGIGLLMGSILILITVICFQRSLACGRKWHSGLSAPAGSLLRILFYGFMGGICLIGLGLLSLEALKLLLRHSDLTKMVMSLDFSYAPVKYQLLDKLMLYSNIAFYVFLSGMILWYGHTSRRTTKNTRWLS